MKTKLLFSIGFLLSVCLISSFTLANGEEWDKSSIEVTGECSDNMAVFNITNTGEPGEGNMDGPSQYRIYRNGVLEDTQNFQLEGGESLVIEIDSSGDEIKLEADQRPGHPGSSNPNEILTCGGGTPPTTTPPTCADYTDQSSCENDSDCEWCLECNGKKWSGGPDKCVDSGNCNYNCMIGHCGAECLPGQTSDKCLPDGTEIFTCINHDSYEYPEYNYCKDTCEWDNCETKIIIEDDPRCYTTLPRPSCGGNSFGSMGSPKCNNCISRPSITRPTITRPSLPSINFQKPTFNFPKPSTPKIPSFNFPRPTFNFPWR